MENNTFSNHSNSWFSWSWNENLSNKVVMTRALLMFACMLLAYAVFQFSWQVTNQANSTGNGPVAALYPTSVSNPLIARISNWSITLTRGCTAVLLGLLINKIGHKNGVIFGLGMMIFSFPYLLTPFIREQMINSNIDVTTASQVSYGLFIVFRMFLAIGGTSILVYITPIIAKFFYYPKYRNACTKITTAPAQLAGIIASLILIDKTTKVKISGDWQLIGGILVGITLLILIVYLIIGMHFKISDSSNKNTQEFMDQKQQNKLSSLLKQPKVWILLIISAFSLYAGIEPASGVLSNFWNRAVNNMQYVWDESGLYINENSISTWQFAWQILYSLGLYVGLVTVAKWLNTKYSVAKYSSLMIFLGLAFWGASFGLGAYSLSNPITIVFTLIFGLLGSTLIFGSQVISSVIVYRWGWSLQQITNYTSFSITFMYLAYSGLDIITSFVGTAGVTSNIATYNDLLAIDPNLINNLEIFKIISKDGTTIVTGIDALKVLGNNLLGSTGNNDWNWSLSNVNYLDLKNYTLDISRNNLSKQYVPQIIVISILPIVSSILYLFIKRIDTETPFSFKHFYHNYMHFNKTKRMFNKVFKTKFEIKDVDNEII